MRGPLSANPVQGRAQLITYAQTRRGVGYGGEHQDHLVRPMLQVNHCCTRLPGCFYSFFLTFFSGKIPEIQFQIRLVPRQTRASQNRSASEPPSSFLSFQSFRSFNFLGRIPVQFQIRLVPLKERLRTVPRQVAPATKPPSSFLSFQL